MASSMEHWHSNFWRHGTGYQQVAGLAQVRLMIRGEVPVCTDPILQVQIDPDQIPFKPFARQFILIGVLP